MKTTWCTGHESPQNTWLQVGHLWTDCLDLKILPSCFVGQYQSLLKDHCIHCLHAEFLAKHAKPHYHSHSTGIRNIFWFMTVARYTCITLPLISLYHSLDPTNCEVKLPVKSYNSIICFKFVLCYRMINKENTVGTPYNTAPYITGSNIARLGHGSQNSWSKLWIPVVNSAPVRVIFAWKSVPKKRIHGSSDIYLGTQWKQRHDSPWSYRLDIIVTFFDMAQ